MKMRIKTGMRALLFVFAAALVSASLIGCGGLSVSHVATLEGFETPESVCIDSETGIGYVSNMIHVPDAENDSVKYWSDDNTGFISTLTPEGGMKKLRWVSSETDYGLNSVKGLCVLNGILYGADNTRIVRFNLETGEPYRLWRIQIPGADNLNDMATDGEAVYVSDTAQGRIYRFGRKGCEELKAPEGVNGITFGGGTSTERRMFAVSWTNHEVYELDPEGKNDPVPFGLAENFTNLDGIETLSDGSFIVTDFTGGKVCWINPERDKVVKLADVKTAADIGLNREAGLLFVPSLLGNKVEVFKLDL